MRMVFLLIYVLIYINTLKKKYTKEASTAVIGIVNTQAQIRLTVTPQRTAEILLVNPTPIIEPVMVCVVLTGTLKCSVKYRVNAPAVSAATPSKEVTLVIFDPIVFTIFQPPLNVPAAIAE